MIAISVDRFWVNYHLTPHLEPKIIALGSQAILYPVSYSQAKSKSTSGKNDFIIEMR